MWWLSVGALAQEIVVKQDAGQSVEEGGSTTLRFESSRPVSIHRILSTSQAYGYQFSSYGETTERLCTAPCTLEVPDGTYQVRVGDNLLFARRLSVSAHGEPQAWRVRDSSAAAGVAGILLTGTGLGGVTGGAMLAALDEPDGVPLALVSTPVAALGLYLLLEAFAEAKPIGP
jgi:hypothetical protein